MDYHTQNIDTHKRIKFCVILQPVYTNENCGSVECKINHYSQINDSLRNVSRLMFYALELE